MPADQTEHFDATPWVPDSTALSRLERAASMCKGCPLYRDATQTVFGDGLKRSRIMLVGEQPGDQEDQRGVPFVGPAGRILDDALVEAAIDRNEVYVTNAVKHFKFERRGKRRIHKTPKQLEIEACRPWLEAERRALRPEIVVALGATAARAIFGRGFGLMKQRGTVHETPWATSTIATIHPSAVLRVDRAQRSDYMAMLVADLTVARRLLEPDN